LNSGENLPVQEIVIIRRKYDDGDHGHHGGMWKIAFADFMTAMMAFFLVMWLISASDEKTLDQLATYFNPIKLPDASKSDKALQNAPGSGAPEHKDEKKSVKTEKTQDEVGEIKEAKQAVSEDALFTDPYGILSKLANQVVRSPLPTPRGLRKEDATQFAGGTAFRDPFDPDFRKRSGAKTVDGTELQGAASRDDVADANALDTATSAAEDAPDEGGEETAPREPVAKAGFAAEKAPGKSRQVKAEEAKAEQAKAGEGKAETPPKEYQLAQGDMAVENRDAQEDEKAPADTAAAKRLERQIKQVLQHAGLRDQPAISVEQTQEGLLISVTDKLNFEMFGLASAQPRPELVVAMENIGKLLLAQNGKIVVRGHTDSRAFRSRGNDNWRLSTDRAHIAHYMLVRGGLPESRFERVEGYADRNLKITSDAKAAANRRIEILLRQPTS
jgi:chemotaxis protein MotB